MKKRKKQYKPVKRDIAVIGGRRALYLYTQVDLYMFRAIYTSKLQKSQIQVLMWILDNSVRLNNIDALFNGYDIIAATGLSRKSVCASLDKLEECNVIRRLDKKSKSKFQGTLTVNMAVEQWDIGHNNEYCEEFKDTDRLVNGYNSEDMNEDTNEL